MSAHLPQTFSFARHLLVALLVVGCRKAADATPGTESSTRTALVRDSVARSRQDSVNRTMPGYVIDSILPVEEELRRFRLVVGGSAVSTLRNASASRDALVARFMRALVAGDSVAMRAMAIDAREFADLIFPESPNTKPPYRQDPALVWRTIQNPSASGLTRLMRRAGGIPVRLTRYTCESTPAQQGANRLWRGCQLMLVGPGGDSSTHRFFGTILERRGQFKFLSYKNEF